MSQPAFSEASIVLVRTHLQEFGEKLARTTVKTPGCVEDIFSIVDMLVDDGMVAYAVIDSAHHAMTRLVVADRAKKNRLITLQFEPNQDRPI